MARARATVTKAEILRALAAAADAGIAVERFEITDGRLVVFAAGAAPAPTTALDQWLASYGKTEKTR